MNQTSNINWGITVPNSIVRLKDLTGHQKFILTLAAKFTFTNKRRGDGLWESNPALHNLFGPSERSMSRKIADMLAKNYICIEGPLSHNRKIFIAENQKTLPIIYEVLCSQDDKIMAKLKDVIKDDAKKNNLPFLSMFYTKYGEQLYQFCLRTLPNLSNNKEEKKNKKNDNSETTEDNDKTLLSESNAFSKAKRRNFPPDNGEFMAYWNTKDSLPKIEQFTGGRQSRLKTRMKEPTFRDNWQAVIDKLSRSDFHTGQNERGWRADVDWLLKSDTNYVRILELPEPDGPEPLARDADGLTQRDKFLQAERDGETHGTR
jgi:hypothetical protein